MKVTLRQRLKKRAELMRQRMIAKGSKPLPLEVQFQSVKELLEQ